MIWAETNAFYGRYLIALSQFSGDLYVRKSVFRSYVCSDLNGGHSYWIFTYCFLLKNLVV